MTVDYEGVSYSLRAGPRQPLPTDHDWYPVAVYAPDEITEEEFGTGMPCNSRRWKSCA